MTKTKDNLPAGRQEVKRQKSTPKDPLLGGVRGGFLYSKFVFNLIFKK